MNYKVKVEETVKITMTGKELRKLIGELDRLSFCTTALGKFYDVLTDASFEVED